jgi:hypothetical protein
VPHRPISNMLGFSKISSIRRHIPFGCRSLSHAKDNVVEFLLHDLSGVNFYLHDSHVTHGESLSSVHHHGQHGLKVKASCRESKEVAQWFNDKTKHGAAFGLRVMSNVKHPMKMDFAVWGNLEFTVDSQVYCIENVVLGQSTENGNNWWIGGEGKHFKRMCVHDQKGSHGALMVNTDAADIMFAPCKSGVENSFAITVFKRELF